MKPIRITEENAAAIESALKEVNGRAYDHAYTSFFEINKIAEAAEAEVVDLLGAKTHAVGAVWHEVSGDKVNNTYARKAFSRAATSVVLERRSTGWFLVKATKTEVGQGGGGKGQLTLTQAQADRAYAKLRERFSVAAPVALAA